MYSIGKSLLPVFVYIELLKSDLEFLFSMINLAISTFKTKLEEIFKYFLVGL